MNVNVETIMRKIWCSEQECALPVTVIQVLPVTVIQVLPVTVIQVLPVTVIRVLPVHNRNVHFLLQFNKYTSCYRKTDFLLQLNNYLDI